MVLHIIDVGNCKKQQDPRGFSLKHMTDWSLGFWAHKWGAGVDYALWEHGSGVKYHWTVIEYPFENAYTVYGLKKKSGCSVILDHPYLECGAQSCVWRDNFLLLHSYALLSMWEWEIASKNRKICLCINWDQTATIHWTIWALILYRGLFM